MNAFFVLDSMHPASLTLRDYSKVVANINCCIQEKISPGVPGGPMPSLRARCFQMSLQILSLKKISQCIFAALIAVCLVFPAALSAQGTGGRILGRVSDPSGAVLAGVKVALVNEATSVSREGTTNEAGDYDFVEVPVGSYRL